MSRDRPLLTALGAATLPASTQTASSSLNALAWPFLIVVPIALFAAGTTLCMSPGGIGLSGLLVIAVTAMPLLVGTVLAVQGVLPSRVGQTVRVWPEAIELVVHGRSTWIEMSEIRGVTLESNLGEATLIIASEAVHQVQELAPDLAYRMRHAISHLAGLPEPDDVTIEHDVTWDESRFRIRYPVDGVGPVEIVVTADGFVARENHWTFAKHDWTEIRSVDRMRTGGITWRTGKGRGYLVQLPASAAQEVHDAMAERLAAARRRHGQPTDPTALRRLQTLRGAPEREG